MVNPPYNDVQYCMILHANKLQQRQNTDQVINSPQNAITLPHTEHLALDCDKSNALAMELSVLW